MVKKLGLIGEPYVRELFTGALLTMDLRRRSIRYRSIQAAYKITYVDRFERKHFLPPTSIDYSGFFELFYAKNIKYIISLTIGTRLHDRIGLGDIVVPHDMIDLAQLLPLKLEHEVGHLIDLGTIFSDKLRKAILQTAESRGIRVVDKAIAVVTSGLRHETPAEAKAYRALGGDIIVNHISAEAFLARIYGMEYLPLVIIAFDPADKGRKQGFEEALDIVKSKYNDLRLLISGLTID